MTEVNGNLGAGKKQSLLTHTFTHWLETVRILELHDIHLTEKKVVSNGFNDDADL